MRNTKYIYNQTLVQISSVVEGPEKSPTVTCTHTPRRRLHNCNKIRTETQFTEEGEDSRTDKKYRTLHTEGGLRTERRPASVTRHTWGVPVAIFDIFLNRIVAIKMRKAPAVGG
jgi:hypothetical protein